MKKWTIALALLLAGCATVRQADLDAWKGMPVEALDTHSLFVTIPMYRSTTSSGIEVRDYANGAEVASCFTSTSGISGSRYVNPSAFTTCTSNRVVCHNLFYIRDGRVLEYAPTGSCFTNDSVRPQARYLDLQRR